MRPSERLFLNRDDVYRSRRARQRAKWLYEDVKRQVDKTNEINKSLTKPTPEAEPAGSAGKSREKHWASFFRPDYAARAYRQWRKSKTSPFPPRRLRPGRWLGFEELIEDEQWHTVAEVADHYPRLLAWLSEGQVGLLWNVFGAWVLILRLIPGVRWLLWSLMFKRVAAVAPWRLALFESILQGERRKLNQKEPHINTEQRVNPSEKYPRPGIGLSAVTEEAGITPTRVRGDLHERIVTMASGCIGISGVRGAGKSTLIQDFCAHRYGTPREPRPDEPTYFLPGLRILVQAPLRFEARDFLIHQYTCLCRAVLADARFNPTTLARQLLLSLVPGRIRVGALLGALSGVIFFAGCALLAYLADSGPWPRTYGDLTNWEVAGAVGAGIAGTVAIGWRTKRAAREVEQIVNLASDAEERLRLLHYQRTDTSSGGGGLTAPMGLGFSVGTSRGYTQQLMTLPELIDDYRDLVQRVVGGLEQAETERERAEAERERRAARRRERQEKRADRPPDERRPAQAGGPACADTEVPAAGTDRGTAVRLVIGIDQMDQIDDPTAAARFLDELSAEFGLPNCVYLLAVSPRTMAAVDQRMIPLKTSSAGMFDEMIWVEPFSRHESAELLESRAVGLSPRLIDLCYVLSGGLPRELLRVARSIVRAVDGQPAETDAGTSESVAVKAVISNEIKALKHRALASAVVADGNGALRLIEKLTNDSWPWDAAHPERDPDIDEVLGNGALLPASPPADNGSAPPSVASEIASNFIAGLYFLLTVHALFQGYAEVFGAADTSANAAAGSGAEPPVSQAEVLGRLAQSSRALGVGPELAVAAVTSAREELRAAGIKMANLTEEVTIPFGPQQAGTRRQPAGPLGG